MAPHNVCGPVGTMANVPSIGAAPGAPTPEGTIESFYRLEEVDYFDGEPPSADAAR